MPARRPFERPADDEGLACPHCLTANAPADDFCLACGAPLAYIRHVEPPETPAESAPVLPAPAPEDRAHALRTAIFRLLLFSWIALLISTLTLGARWSGEPAEGALLLLLAGAWAAASITLWRWFDLERR